MPYMKVSLPLFPRQVTRPSDHCISLICVWFVILPSLHCGWALDKTLERGWRGRKALWEPGTAYAILRAPSGSLFRNSFWQFGLMFLQQQYLFPFLMVSLITGFSKAVHYGGKLYSLTKKQC